MLLAHVLTALVGLGAIVVSAGCALALARSGADSESLRRYYRPGVNWAGRVLFLVPVFGVALIAMSHGEWSFSDPWVGIGLVVWAVVAMVAELVLWPAERRLQVDGADQPSARGDLRLGVPSPGRGGRRCLARGAGGGDGGDGGQALNGGPASGTGSSGALSVGCTGRAGA